MNKKGRKGTREERRKRGITEERREEMRKGGNEVGGEEGKDERDEGKKERE